MKQLFAKWKTVVQQRHAVLLQTTTHAWNARTAREQHFLLGAGVTIAVTLFYLILIGPALQGRAQLQRSLPQLRMQAAQLRALADTATILPVAADTTSMLSRQKLEGTLRQHGLKAQNVSISGDGVRLQFDDVPFAQLLDCLRTLQKTQQLVVADAALNAKDKAGMVSATLQLNRQKDE